MKSRESNAKMVVVFVLCAVTISIITWTIGAKFISDSRLLLIVNLFVSIAIALCFERYLEFKINSSIDFLISKLQRISKGDLTQRFTEDPDDILPYGLSHQLGEMMKFFRENVGGLWKTTSLLAKQLNQFVESTNEALNEFRSEVDYLSNISGSLEQVRKETMAITKKVSDFDVEAGSDVTLMGQIDEICQQTPSDLNQTNGILKNMALNVDNLLKSIGNIRRYLNDFSGLSHRITAAIKSMTELKTEAHLVKLNASIDQVRETADPQNVAKLIDEAKQLAKKISEISQESGDTFSIGSEKVKDLTAELDNFEQKLQKDADTVTRTVQVIQTTNEKSSRAASDYTQVFSHVKDHKELIEQLNYMTVGFGSIIKKSADRFNKLDSDTRITLIKFNDLEGRISAITNNLTKLEGFRDSFQIG